MNRTRSIHKQVKRETTCTVQTTVQRAMPRLRHPKAKRSQSTQAPALRDLVNSSALSGDQTRYRLDRRMSASLPANVPPCQRQGAERQIQSVWPQLQLGHRKMTRKKVETAHSHRRRAPLPATRPNRVARPGCKNAPRPKGPHALKQSHERPTRPKTFERAATNRSTAYKHSPNTGTERKYAGARQSSRNGTKSYSH